ncbi:MAG TPA: GntR family transcriptional regulator [Solirubrobacteraceae bacterium]|nr:GntR family transcriptional regulator [Solirubrobacteraceae bacterium]
MAPGGEPSSRHATIAAALREQIKSGALAPGTDLPSESELSQTFSVSRGTVRQALAALRTEGLITGGRGRRPVVTRSTLTQSFDQLISFSAWAQELGSVPSARTLELARRPADAEAAARLNLEPGTPVFQYKRLRLLNGEPMMIELTTWVEPIGRLLLDFDMDTGSVYAQLNQHGVIFHEAQQSITAVAASSEQAELLGVARRAPLLAVSRVAFDPEGHAIEYSRDTYRADSFVITIHNQIALARSGVRLSLVS